jgi:hypothetical protein
MEATHKKLLGVCLGINEDYAKWTNNHELPDCSCGCKFFHELEGARGADWGVCFNPKSLRAGLLTFEHMGCKEFKDDK